MSNCITDDIITFNYDSLGQNLDYIFIMYPYFLKFSSILMNMQNR